MIYNSIIWPFMSAVLYSVCLAWCGAIVVSASGRSGTSWWMTMTTFVAQTPKNQPLIALWYLLIIPLHFTNLLQLNEMNAAQSWEHNWSLSGVYFTHQSSACCPYIPDIFPQWRVDTREQFMMFCLMNYMCAVLNNFIIVPEMLVSLYAKQNIVAKPQKTTCRS